MAKPPSKPKCPAAVAPPPTQQATAPAAPTQTTPSPDDPLHAAALVDPVLAAARRSQLAGIAPRACYDDAWDDWIAAQPAAPYEPPEDLAEYLRGHWPALLLEGEAERAKAGRPTLLTRALLEQIEECARSGAKDPIIYTKLGIRQQLWSEWTRDPEGELCRTLARARAVWAESTLRGIGAMPKGWQAGVWLLTQLYPELYSRPNADTQINVNASASAQASAHLGIVITNEKMLEIQARQRRALEKQVERVRKAQQMSQEVD